MYDLWQQPELPSELESDLLDSLDGGRKWLNGLDAEKTQLVPLSQSNNCGGIDMKIDESALQEKSSFKMLGLSFSP